MATDCWGFFRIRVRAALVPMLTAFDTHFKNDQSDNRTLNRGREGTILAMSLEVGMTASNNLSTSDDMSSWTSRLREKCLGTLLCLH